MIQTNFYNPSVQPNHKEKTALVNFLSDHLEEYGDTKQDIEKCLDYAMKKNGSKGGFVVTATLDYHLAGVAIINETGMDGYIPENILVYIATHKDHRGKGVASSLMHSIIETCQGNIALHVEPNNPALKLYEKFGFTNKYLEMRLTKKA